MVTGARLGDIFGRKRLFVIGAARVRRWPHSRARWPPTPSMLIGFRLLSGCCGRAAHPAGPRPDPAHPRGPGPGPRDEQVLRGAGRRRGGGPGRRRPADQRQPVRLGLAAGLPGQRAHRRAAAGGRRPGAAARQGRARPDPRPARPGPAHPGRARVRPPARARPARTLAGLGLGPDGRERAPGRRLRRRRAAGGRVRRHAADPRPGAAGARRPGRDRRPVHGHDHLQRVLLHPRAAPAGRPGLLPAPGGPDLRPGRGHLRPGQPELAAAAGPVAQRPDRRGLRRVRGRDGRPGLLCCATAAPGESAST